MLNHSGSTIRQDEEPCARGLQSHGIEPDTATEDERVMLETKHRSGALAWRS